MIVVREISLQYKKEVNKMIGIIFALGEIFSLITMLYIKYFGSPDELFTNYDDGDDIDLCFTALCCGWILFPFFMYCLYKQIQINKK